MIRAAFALVLLSVLPVVLGPYAISSLTRILAFALLAAGLDLLVGFAGLASLGQAGYFGAGAYAAALTGIHLTPFAPAQLAAGLLAGAVAAALTGWLAVQTRGVPFLMLTLAIGALIYQFAEALTPVTGGTNGLAGVPPISLGFGPVTLSGIVYWYVLGSAALLFLGLVRLARSPFGRRLAGLRGNEARMRALGYAPSREAYAAFCVAGALAGAAGSLWVAQSRFFSPADMGFEVAVLALLAVVIGISGTLWGPCLGAAAVLLVRDNLSAYVGGHGPFLLGLAFIAAVYALPGRRNA